MDTFGSRMTTKPRRSKARSWLVTASLVIHAGAIGAYVVLGMMRIEQLKPDRGRIEVAVGPRMQDPGGGPEPGMKPKDPPRPEPKKHTTKDIVQAKPTTPVTTDTSDQTPTQATGDTTGTTPGGGGGTDPTKPPGGGGGCVGPDCKDDPKPEPPKQETKQEVVNVAPTVIQKLRISGDTQLE